MHISDPIESSLESAFLEEARRPRDELGFYLVASNRELLNHVEGLMNRLGVFGVMDLTGRVHYVLDGRKGPPFAMRKLMTVADQLLVGREAQSQKSKIRQAVSQVMNRYAWNTQLRGYRFLAELLRLAVQDMSLINPISKRLYPELARAHRLEAKQVERNVRYLLDDLALRELGGDPEVKNRLLLDGQTKMPVGGTIIRLLDYVWEVMEAMEEEEAKKEKRDPMLA